MIRPVETFNFDWSNPGKSLLRGRCTSTRLITGSTWYQRTGQFSVWVFSHPVSKSDDWMAYRYLSADGQSLNVPEADLRKFTTKLLQVEIPRYLSVTSHLKRGTCLSKVRTTDNLPTHNNPIRASSINDVTQILRCSLKKKPPKNEKSKKSNDFFEDLISVHITSYTQTNPEKNLKKKFEKIWKNQKNLKKSEKSKGELKIRTYNLVHPKNPKKSEKNPKKIKINPKKIRKK